MGWFDRKRHDSGEWTGFLDQGVKLEGRLECSGTFRIDSAMKGTLVSHETLILGEHAKVEGQIEGNYVIIGGHFDGTDQSLRQSGNSNQSHRHRRNPYTLPDHGTWRDFRRPLPHALRHRGRETHNHSHPFGRRARITGTQSALGEAVRAFPTKPATASAL